MRTEKMKRLGPIIAPIFIVVVDIFTFELAQYSRLWFVVPALSLLLLVVTAVGSILWMIVSLIRKKVVAAASSGSVPVLLALALIFPRVAFWVPDFIFDYCTLNRMQQEYSKSISSYAGDRPRFIEFDVAGYEKPTIEIVYDESDGISSMAGRQAKNWNGRHTFADGNEGCAVTINNLGSHFYGAHFFC